MEKQIKITYTLSGIVIGILLLFAISGMLFSKSVLYELLFVLSIIPAIIAIFGYIPFVIYMIIFSVKVYKETKNWKYILINIVLVVITPPLWSYWVMCHQV